MFVETNGSGYLLFCSSPAKTVERDETGNQPVVGKPGLVTAESSETCAEVCNWKLADRTDRGGSRSDTGSRWNQEGSGDQRSGEQPAERRFHGAVLCNG